MNKLRSMLNPRAVALIGATDREESIGFAVLKNLLKAPRRPVYPVNPGRNVILGMSCFPSIREAPSPVDLAVIVTPAPSVPAIVKDCGQAGVAGVIILSAGFSESGPDGKLLEDEINEIRKKYNMRVIGPNCLGVIIPHIKLNATFLSIDARPGKIAFLSHALGEELLEWGGTVGIGFSMFASLGSLIDVGFGDLIDFLNNDFRTRSIMMYMEHVEDPRHFISAGRGFALTKPIVVLKAGKSPEGSRVISERTGRPTGDDRVYDAVFKRTGMMRVNEVRDLLSLAEVLDSGHLPASPNLTVITNDGGVGVIAADALKERGGHLSELPDHLAEEMSTFLPRHWSKRNPIDIMADADTRRYVDTVRSCLYTKDTDGVLVIYTPRPAADPIDVANSIISLYRTTPKPIIAVCMGGKRAAKARRALLAGNVPAYATPEEAIKTYMYMYGYRRNIELLYETPAEVIQGESPFKEVIRNAIRDAAAKTDPRLDDKHIFVMLRHYGIPVDENLSSGLMFQLASYRDPEFKSVILLGITENYEEQTSIALPPLNRTLARRFFDDLLISPVTRALFDDPALLEKLEDILVNFGNIVIDFPEIEKLEITLTVYGPDVAVSSAGAHLVKNYKEEGIYDHLVITPYPSHYERKTFLRNGMAVELKPMRPEDELMGREMLSSLSEQTLRTRFFGIPRIDHEMLIRFCNIDYDREIAITATIRENEKIVLIGGFRLIQETDPDTAQFAILVRDNYQGMGVGKLLMEEMIDIANEKKLRQIFGIVLSDNERMIALCRSMGFTAKNEPQGTTRVSLVLSG